MRQGDGADLLGASDPRNANIGVIYVAPSDDRQSVLAAILTQDKLGRKQVAVVLPEHNKAFQRPVDFEGLKNMRRGLKTQIVFVAPPGPGPAEFARQRRFPVFSSPESFAQSLRAEDQFPATGRKGLFGRRPKASNGAVPVSSTGVAEGERTQPLPGSSLPAPAPVPEELNATLPGTGDQEEEGQHEQQQDEARGASGAAAGVAGLAAGLGIGALAAHSGEGASSPPDEDWDALPPAAGESQPVDRTSPVHTPGQDELESGTTNDSQGSAGPGIIVFPSPQARPRSTGKLPAAVAPAVVAVPPAQSNIPPAAPPIKRRNVGKNAAIASGAAVAGGAVGAALVSQTPSTGGTPPPPGGNAGGPGGGGGGGGPRRRTSRTLLVVLLILLTLLLVAGIAFAAPGGIGRISNVLPGASPTATVTITPVSADKKDTFVLTAVTGTPDATKRQVQARKLSYTTPPQSKTVQATGQVSTKAIQATGVLTFYNGNGFVYTVRAGTVFTDSHGVQIENVGQVSIPAGNPSSGYGRTNASAMAVFGGTNGNIKAFDFNLVQCCGSGAVYISNASAFTGGQDPQHFTAVSQSDIDGAANPLKTSQTQSAQQSLQSQIHGNERLINPAQCSTNVTSDHKAGDRATSVMVTVTATCTGEVYDQQAATAIATNLLKTEEQKNLGSAYVLQDNKVVTQVTSIIDTNGLVSLYVKAEGIWVYQFSDAMKQNLARLIAGKNEADAKTLLLKQAGVSGVQISISSGTTLPSDPANITIIIKAVPGLPGTPTVTPPTGPTPGTQTPPTATPTSEPGLGGS